MKKAICPICGGSGKVNDKKTGLVRSCAGCKGVGQIKETPEAPKYTYFGHTLN